MGEDLMGVKQLLWSPIPELPCSCGKETTFLFHRPFVGKEGLLHIFYFHFNLRLCDNCLCYVYFIALSVDVYINQ